VSDDPYLAFEDDAGGQYVSDEPASWFRVYLFFPGVAAIAKTHKCLEVKFVVTR
jgi:hypothetical protein